MPLRIAADIARSLLNSVLQRKIRLLPSLLELIFRNTQRLALAQSVPARSVAAYGAIAVTADVIHNAADRRFDLGQIGRTAPGQRRHQTSLRGAFENAHGAIAHRLIAPRLIAHRPIAHHITTLFSGYSTMP